MVTPRSSNRIWTYANAITVSRLLSAIAAIHLQRAGYLSPIAGYLLFLVMFWAADSLDGYVARRFDQASELGAALDLAADRLLDLYCSYLMMRTIGSESGLVLAFVLVRFGFEPIVFAGKLAAATQYQKSTVESVEPPCIKWIQEYSSIAKALFFGYWIFLEQAWNSPDAAQIVRVLFISVVVGYAIHVISPRTVSTICSVRNSRNADT